MDFYDTFHGQMLRQKTLRELSFLIGEKAHQ